MAEPGRITFAPPSIMPGVTRMPPNQGMMLKQLANRGAEQEDESGQAQASDLLKQGITKLQQAAALDPRIAPLVQKALSPLMGGEGAPELSMKDQTVRSNYGPSPGGRIPS